MHLSFNLVKSLCEKLTEEYMPMTRDDAEKILLSSGWLTAQPSHFQQEVLRRSVLLSFSAGNYMYRMGDPPGGIYALVSGNVAINSVPSDETPKLMQLGRPGAWTGEGSYITRQPRLIELRAKVPAWMMHLPLDKMDKMDKMAFQNPISYATSA